MPEAQNESPPVTNRWVSISIASPPEGVEIEVTEGGALWRIKPRKVVQVFHSQPDPEADAARIMAKAAEKLTSTDWVEITHLSGRKTAAPAWFEWREQVRDAARGKRGDIPPEPERWTEAPASPAPSEEHKFPAPHEKLTDWDVVGAIPDDLAQLILGDEPLADAVERMTPGLDELLDMAEMLSESSFETAINEIPPERFNEWTERLFSERGTLRRKRGTDEENLTRENLINRVATIFARVGAKR